MGNWLLDTLTKTNYKGQTQVTVTADVNEETSVKGPRSVTVLQPEKITTKAAATTTQTVTEDAGGTITFRIPIKGGMGASAAPAMCPTP
jgi:hypothetical protein